MLLLYVSFETLYALSTLKLEVPGALYAIFCLWNIPLTDIPGVKFDIGVFGAPGIVFGTVDWIVVVVEVPGCGSRPPK